jgi:cytochrome b561
MGPNKVLAKKAMAAHELVAYLILALVLLHAPPRFSISLSGATTC